MAADVRHLQKSVDRLEGKVDEMTTSTALNTQRLSLVWSIIAAVGAGVLGLAFKMFTAGIL